MEASTAIILETSTVVSPLENSTENGTAITTPLENGTAVTTPLENGTAPLDNNTGTTSSAPTSTRLSETQSA